MTLNDRDEIIEKSRHIIDEEPDWKIVGSLSRRGSVTQQEQWGSFGGIQWEGPSIFEEDNTSPTPSFRHRSLSFSMGQDLTFFGYDDLGRKSTLSPLEEDQVWNNRLHRSMDDTYFRTHPFSPSNSTQSSSSSYWNRRSSLIVSPTPFTDLYHGPSTKIEEEEPGKGISLQNLPSHVLLYMIEFKSGRTDFYYYSEPMLFQIGDLVMVEADRGKDLGKIATDTLTMSQVMLLKQQQQTSNSNRLILDDEECDRKDIYVKRIYRKAGQDEISLLAIKEQDEQKALSTCLQKIKQKKLQMEVVDAEFQWDRRKLTFYFIAEKRIDFRELVRELFKIYKTRIWMCAVNPTIPIKSVTSFTA